MADKIVASTHWTQQRLAYKYVTVIPDPDAASTSNGDGDSIQHKLPRIYQDQINKNHLNR